MLFVPSHDMRESLPNCHEDYSMRELPVSGRMNHSLLSNVVCMLLSNPRILSLAAYNQRGDEDYRRKGLLKEGIKRQD